ncbi:hypothetical protein Hoch_0530 [Haliangium ochraceum DSM 14365]|uniref:Uncharacterized protein n=1 Tax=Haliangium ochraceum (strain DSM 14365 / JCM 11303 / SMP-2) TaxID=502025 RepID=D0LKD4_HALO1|nr:hypothetical protein Hoch_0530 [Haliangium ochraceum DSM 14365]
MKLADAECQTLRGVLGVSSLAARGPPGDGLRRAGNADLPVLGQL